MYRVIARIRQLAETWQSRGGYEVHFWLKVWCHYICPGLPLRQSADRNDIAGGIIVCPGLPLRQLADRNDGGDG